MTASTPRSVVGAFSVSMTATSWSRGNTFANHRGLGTSSIEAVSDRESCRPANRLAKLLPITLLLLAGCGWMSDDKGLLVDRSDDYLDAVEAPPLRVPDDLAQVADEPGLAVPQVSRLARQETYPDEAPRPNAIYGDQSREGLKIQKLGERRWLVVPQAPAIVWPKVRQFLADNGVAAANEVPEDGRIDTEWLTVDEEARDVIRLTLADARATASVDEGRDRYLLRVEQGIRPRTSEIHIRHENDALATPSEKDFLEVSAVLQAEQELLNELGAYLAAHVSDEAVSYVARNISTQTKASIEQTEDGQPLLKLYLDFERAWATVGQALVAAEFEVADSDPDARVYFVKVTDDQLEQKKDWFLIEWFDRDRAIDMQIRMEPWAQGYEVGVYDADAAPVAKETGEQILVMIREFAL
jgi:outer membrane protein assembly factor BamC